MSHFAIGQGSIRYTITSIVFSSESVHMSNPLALPPLESGDSDSPMNGYKIWRGIPLAYINGQEMLNGLDTLELRADDIIVFTYPKCGTHFVGGIIVDILESCGKLNPEHRTVLPLEIGTNFDKLESVPRESRRVMLTHIPWDLLPTSLREGNQKFFHVMRNPKDAMCSSFAFFKKVKVLRENLTMDEMTEYYINDKAAYGDYFKWLKSWYPVRTNERFLNLQFEDMREDLIATIKMVAAHLGEPLTEEQLQSVVSKNEFKNKKKATTGFEAVFMRAGEAGGWKDELTEEQVAKLDKWITSGIVGLDGIDLKC